MEKRCPVDTSKVEWLVLDGFLKEMKSSQEEKKTSKEILKKTGPKKGIFERWAF